MEVPINLIIIIIIITTFATCVIKHFQEIISVFFIWLD